MKFRYIFFTLALSVVFGGSFFGQSFAQVTWNTFEEKDGLFSIQIPSNWNASEVPETEALAPIDYIFRYIDKGNSFAWLELMIDKPLYSDARTAAESYISDYQQFDDFILLQPIDCNMYTLNDVPACSFLSSQQLEGEERRNVLDIVSISPNGIQTDVIFITSSNIYDTFLPVGEYIINSLDINSTMVDRVLNNQSTESIRSESPVIPTHNDTTSPQSEIPPLSTENETSIQQETFRSVFDTYENPNLGFLLEYPADWAKEETLSFISPPPSPSEKLSASNVAPESIAVTTEVLFSNITLDEYSESAIGLLESQFPNFTLIDSFETTLSGYPAHQIEYTYTLEGLNLKNMQIWTIADNNVAYVLTYGGIIEEFDSSLPVIENMIESFQLFKPQPSQEFDTSPTFPTKPTQDWMQICSIVEVALYNSCSELVNPNGSLTYLGQITFECVVSGFTLGGLASTIIPPAIVLKGLDILSESTGCGGLVKLDILESVSGLDGILDMISNMLV